MAPKPKGLKASKRAAPFDPSTVADESAASTSTPAASNPERTYPLDEDALTLADLFELRSSVADILYPFPNSLSLAHADPDRFDEARSLLRGILHGCAVLEQLVEREEIGDTIREDDTGPRSKEAVQKRRQEAGEDKLEALGLNDDCFEEGMLLYLQGWALQHLGDIFEKPEEALRAGAIKSATGSKKRKIDVNEPHSKEAWLEAALERFKLLVELVQKNYAEDCRGESLFVDLICAGDVDCKLSLAEAYYEAGKGDEAIKAAPTSDDLDYSIYTSWGIHHGRYEQYPVKNMDSSDSALAQLRAWSKWIAFVEAHPSAEPVKTVAELDKDISMLKSMDKQFATALNSDHHDDEKKKAIRLWAFLHDVVVADARLARFILLEDVVESTYRPDAADEMDEEAEVKPLPLDAKEVVEAKRAGEEALSALRATITAFSSLPASFAHPSAKDEQYRKLEEALLVYSALINPDDKAGTENIEKEIAQVRKDGGLEDDEEDAADQAEK
ncbi:hypothetical protein JCM5296_006285 [Sporobolomyces johnsonii]